MTGYAANLGITIVGEEGGAPVCLLAFSQSLVGRPDYLHGGVIAGLLEVAGYEALKRVSCTSGALSLKPINVTVDYLRNGRPEETFAVARIVKLGTRVANLESEAWQGDRLSPIAIARMNVSVGSPEKHNPP